MGVVDSKRESEQKHGPSRDLWLKREPSFARFQKLREKVSMALLGGPIG